jgi:uncharacterized membrane protein
MLFSIFKIFQNNFKKKIIVINDEDRQPINKIKNFIKKALLLIIASSIVIFAIYIAIILSIFVIFIALFAIIIGLLYVRFRK